MANRISRTLCLLLLAVAVAPAAEAQLLDSGFYMEIGVGRAKFSGVTAADGDAVTRDFFDSFNLPVQTLSSSLKTRDRSNTLLGGYKLNPYFAVEGGFFRLGAYQYSGVGTVDDADTIKPATFAFGYRAKGFLVGGAATLPLGNYLELRARAGFSTTDTRIRYTATAGTDSTHDGFSANSQDIFIGAGVGLRFWDYYRFGVDLMRHNKLGSASGNGNVDVDNLVLSIGFTY